MSPERPLVISLAELASIWLRAPRAAVSTPQPASAATEAPQPLASASAPASQPTLSAPEAPTPRELHQPSLESLVLEPYRSALGPAWEPLRRLCQLLDTSAVTCPSIVLVHEDQDEESRDLAAIRDTLSNVSLRDHTIHVVGHALAQLKQEYRDWEPLVGLVLTAALGHDLGKLPQVRESGAYTMHDHPQLSALKVRELFQDAAVPWLDQAVTMIQDHHRASATPLTQLLQRADQLARQDEVVAVTKLLQVKPWDEWCTAAALLAELFPRINVPVRGGSWEALSCEGVVYCRPDALYAAAQRVAHAARVLDMTLVAASAREAAYRRIVATLKAAQVLAVDIGDGFYGVWYEVRWQSGRSKRHYLVPIRLDAFGARASDLEQVKARSGITLAAITPAMHARATSHQ